MAILPIVARELRVASRRKSVYRLRLVAGVLTLALGTFFLVFGENLTWIASGTAGRTLFLIVSFLLSGWAVASSHLTYDSVSGEKREGTIGFLFLTELEAHDIVIGKLFAAALPSFYAMLATVPLLAFAVLIGGVTGDEIWSTSLALLNLFFFAQSAAILASTFSRERSTSAKITVSILSFFIVAVALANALSGGHLWWAESLNPAYTFAVATGLDRSQSSGGFWLSLANVHAVAWIFLGLSSVRLPQIWRERPEEVEAVVLRSRSTGPVHGNPFSWLLTRRMPLSRTIWIALGCYLCVAILLLPFVGRHFGYWYALLLIPHVALKFWLAVATGYPMEEQRRNGSLEILLASTSLTEKEILDGQQLALRRLFLGPCLALLALDFVTIVFLNDIVAGMAILGAAVTLLIDLVTLRWLATWFAMAQKKPGRAGFTAFFWVCVFPGVFLGLPMVSVGGTTNYVAEFSLWLLLSAFLDAIFLSTARDKLLVHLRTMSGTVTVEKRKIGLFQELDFKERAVVLRS